MQFVKPGHMRIPKNEVNNQLSGNKKATTMRSIISRLAAKLGFRNILPGFDLHVELRHLYRQLQEDFFFLQIGANDGRSNDPIYPFVNTYHPSGILVEPQPDAFAQLQATYPNSDFPSLKLINAAIAPSDSIVKLYRIARDFEDTYRSLYKRTANASGITSMDYEHVRSFLLKVLPDFFADKNVDDYIEQITVPAISIDTLLRENNVNHVDFVQIDTEGYDAEVIQMVFSCDIIQDPELIHFEIKHLSDREQKEIRGILAERDYSVVVHEGDACAFKTMTVK